MDNQESKQEQLKKITEMLAQILLEIPILHHNNPMVIEVRRIQVAYVLTAVASLGDFSVKEVTDMLHEETIKLSNEYKKWERVDIGDEIINDIIKRNDKT
jgi:hypothetical protein